MVVDINYANVSYLGEMYEFFSNRRDGWTDVQKSTAK